MQTFIIKIQLLTSMLTRIIIYLALILLVLISLFLLYWRLYFLRDPKRTAPKGRNIVSPADGKIMKIATINKSSTKIDKKYIGKIYTTTKDIAPKTKIISIFMSPLDVHYNRAPIDGKVISVKYTKGKFFPANNLKKSLQNEKNEIIIKNKSIGKIKVIQIAGILARRIECYVKENQNVIKSQKIGLINLGSQCILVLPDKLKLKVKERQQVYAGETIIAEY